MTVHIEVILPDETSELITNWKQHSVIKADKRIKKYNAMLMKL